MSEDLARVAALPRRPAYDEDDPAVVETARRITAEFRRPGGTQEAWPVQGFAVDDFRKANGGLGIIVAGGGKTLTSFLTAAAFPEVPGRPRVTVLLIPSALVVQARADWRALAAQWYLPNLVGEDVAYSDARGGIVHIVSYEMLSSQREANILDRLNPDLIIADECHSVARTSSARTKRFLHFFKSHPNCRFVGLSGTIANRSITEFSHLSRLALRKGSPLPIDWPTLQAWSYVLDATEEPADPGELYRIGGPDVDRAASIRSVFRDRLVSTPGIVATTAGHFDCELRISERKVPVPERINLALRRLRKDWVTPGDDPIADAMALAGHARELACGFYYRRIWPNNEPEHIRKEWIEARREWFAEVREFITHRAKPGLDTLGLVENAARDGRFKSHSYGRWDAVRDLACPATEAVWVDDFLVRDAVKWGQEAPGIIWYSHDAVGRAIAEAGRFPLFEGGPAASEGIRLEKGDRTIVATERAHGQGKNLQAFTRSLVTTPSSSGKVQEQLLARTHRGGQKADFVEYTYYTHVPEQLGALKSAVRDCVFGEELLGGQKRLLYAKWLFPVDFLSSIS